MNVISTAAYVVPAAYFYHKNRTTRGAVTGLLLGSSGMVLIMLLWNYLLTPIFMNVPRSVVVGMLIPAIMPFNLLKAGLNSVLAFVLYKPLVSTLRRAKLVAESAAMQK